MKYIKAQIKESNDIPFEPFYLQIHVKDEDMLQKLWHTFNMSSNDVLRCSTKDAFKQEGATVSTKYIFEELNIIAQDRGLKK